jgi:glycine cleavage system H protein
LFASDYEHLAAIGSLHGPGAYILLLFTGEADKMETANHEECPFLREEKVVFCKAFPLKKILPLQKIFEKENLCVQEEHTSCPVYMKKTKDEFPQTKICHFMGTENIIYCKLSPIKKMIPLYSLKFEGPCSNGTYGDCVYYRNMLQGGQRTVWVQGFAVEEMLYYHSSHIWLRRTDDSIRLGLDDFGQFVIGSIVEVLLPEVGQRVKVDVPFMSLMCDDGVADLSSPVDGTVTRVNRAVYLDSSLIKLDPYGEGWLAEVRPSGESVLFDRGTSHLFHGDTIQPWIQREVSKLRQIAEAEVGGIVAVADGGEIWRGLRDEMGEQRRLLIRSFFSKEGRQKCRT